MCAPTSLLDSRIVCYAVWDAKFVTQSQMEPGVRRTKIWEDVVEACFRMSFRHSHRDTRENHDNLLRNNGKLLQDHTALQPRT